MTDIQKQSVVFDNIKNEQEIEETETLISKVLAGKSKAVVMAQYEVAALFKKGIDGKRSANDNYRSCDGVLEHYGTTEGLRLKNGKIVENLQCWSAGFATCSLSGADYRLPITTLERFGSSQDLRNMEILDYDNSKWTPDALIKIENTLLLFGQDEYNMFLVELPRDENITTIEQAFKALQPKLLASLPNAVVKRQGDLFFVETNLLPHELTNLEKQHFEKRIRVVYDSGRDLNQEIKELIRPQIFKTNHQVAKLATYESKDARYGFGVHTVVSGKVYHGRNQHQSLDLGEKWHIVLQNRGVRSWQVDRRGSNGGFD